MFRNIFSFDGRIRRKEYCITMLAYVIAISIAPLTFSLGNEPNALSAKLAYRFGWHAPEMAASLVIPLSTTPVMLSSAWFLVYDDAFKEYYFEKIAQKEDVDINEAKSYATSKAIIGALWLSFFPILFFWLIAAQGTKRCHDLGKSGWTQLIPFYNLSLLFTDGVVGENAYGDNPKGIVIAKLTKEEIIENAERATEFNDSDETGDHSRWMPK